MPTDRESFRLREPYKSMITEIAEHQGGLTRTRTVEWAIERLHADVMKDQKKNQKNPSPLS